MRRLLLAAAAATLLAGCGDDGGGAPTGPPAAPVAEQVKLDLRTAAIYLEAHRTTEGTYTNRVADLPAGFPATVTIRAADASTYTLTARAAGGGTYTLRGVLGEETRTCAPASGACRNGTW